MNLCILSSLSKKSEHGVTLDRLILPLSLYPDLQAKDFQIINIIELVNSGKYKLFELEQELQLILAGNEQIKKYAYRRK